MTAHSTRAHAKLSPSAAHRWVMCAGSIAACEGIPNKSSRFAEEGTAAHTLAEFCFSWGHDADAYLGDYVDIGVGTILGKDLVGHPGAQGIFEITEEMAEAVQVYLDYIRPLCEGAEVEVEAKLDLRSIPGMEFGTGDFCAYNSSSMTLDIADLKFGKGVKVFAKDNPQLLTYALGVARRFHNRGVKKARIAIIQPRLDHIDVAELDGIDLLDFEADLTAAALATAEPNAPRRAGDWCKFCPAGPGCAEFAAKAMSAAIAVFDGEQNSIVEPSLLNSDELATALRRVHVLKAWLKRMEEFAHSEAMAGRLPTGFKLVAKRATRKWRDEGAATTALALQDVDPWKPREVVSPAQAEKALGKKRAAAILEPLVERVSGGTNLVPVEDERQPARPEVEAVFEALA